MFVMPSLLVVAIIAIIIPETLRVMVAWRPSLLVATLVVILQHATATDNQVQQRPPSRLLLRLTFVH